MPLFLTLTYDNEHIPLTEDGVRTVSRSDMSKFLKEYKRRYNLRQEEFQYFGCCEYGDLFARPHGHLLFFGERKLYDFYMRDSEKAQKRVFDVWQKGHVHIGVATYAGIAYVTKYCLKSNPEDYNGKQARPFTIASNGLGMNYLKSVQARQDMAKLHELKWNFPEILENMPTLDFYSKNSIKRCLEYLREFLPSFTCVLDDGTKVFVPRAIRKKMVGTFEHYKDNPLWLYNHLNNLLDSIEYYNLHGEDDRAKHVSAAYEKSMMKIDSIRVNKNIVAYNKKQKRLIYESV